MSQQKSVNLKNKSSTFFSPAVLGVCSVILYCLWSYLNVWEVNFVHNEYIDYPRLFAAYAITLCFAGFVFLFIYLLTGRRSLARALFATAAFVLVFFNFHFLSQYTDHVRFGYFILLGLAIPVGYYFAKNLLFQKLAVIIPIAAIIGIVTSVISQKPKIIQVNQPEDWSKSIFANPTEKQKHTPNVYFIILDSTLRVDGYKRFFDKEDKSYDDFLTYAQEKGFYFVKNAYSNYPVTGFSIPSTLNMDFMTWSKSEGPDEIKQRPPYNPETLQSAMRGYNAVTVAFKARGYKIYHTSNGFLPASDCGGFEDKCIKKPVEKKNILSFTQQELGLIKMTPLQYVLDRLIVRYKPSPDAFIPNISDDTISFYHSFQPRDIPQYIPENDGKPFFWFIHLMGMHNLAFAEDCSYKHTCDNIDFSKLKQACQVTPPSEKRALAYIGQLPCMFSQLKLAIDEIIKRDPDAIIVLQGDHGSSVVNNFKTRPTEQWTEKDVHEVFSILNVIRCPAECQKLLYDDITPVNTFRVIFSYLDDKKYPLLPDISYVAAYSNWWPSYKNGDADLLNPSLKKHPFSCDVLKK